MLEADLTHSVIGSFYDVRRALGPGLREYIYALALERDLRGKGHRVEREVPVMIYYRGEPLAAQTIDMVVDGKLIVEHKAKEYLPDDASAQVFGYLAASDLELGLVLHYAKKPRFYRVIYENRFKVRSGTPVDF
jgi:GxxExxY protein